MSLVPVFSVIKSQMLSNIATVFTPFNPNITSEVPPYIQMWNNQVKYWKNKAKEKRKEYDNESEIYDVLFPAVMVEFIDLKTERLGDNSQIFPKLNIRIHIVDLQLDAGDGTMEQNLEVFAIADAVYLVLDQWKPSSIPCAELVRREQKLDYDHDNLYHYTIDYITTYVDNLTAVPVDGVVIPGATVTPVIEETYN